MYIYIYIFIFYTLHICIYIYMVYRAKYNWGGPTMYKTNDNWDISIFEFA